jgi:uncharacterized protein DUF1579
MKRRSITITLCLVAASAFFAGRLISQGTDDEKKAMEAFQAYMTPGKEHKMLEKRAGTWDYKASMYMAPGAPPTVTKGKSVRKMAMGGRFLLDETSGEGMAEFGGTPFQGSGITAFDNYKKKFVSTWIDNMGTGIMISEGEASADGKTITYTSEEPDLMGAGGGKMRKTRTVEKILSEDHTTLEMFAPGPDGKEVKNFELEYTRKK